MKKKKEMIDGDEICCLGGVQLYRVKSSRFYRFKMEVVDGDEFLSTKLMMIDDE